MSNEKRLIDANVLKTLFDVRYDTASIQERTRSNKEQWNGYCTAINWGRNTIANAPTVDAVEVAELREFAKDVAYQFGYYCQCNGGLHITHGGLSTLEQAFDILGWENPHPVPECECEIDGCHEHATCGAPTNDGYKRMCGKHCLERRKGE